MDTDEPLQRLYALKRDLCAFAEQRLPNVARLSAELDASIEDLRNLLGRKKKSETSRKELAPGTTPAPETVKIRDIEYKINDDFREAALSVSDELDLDELEAAKLCLDALEGGEMSSSLPYKALLRFHHQRVALLECFRLILQQHADTSDPDDENRVFWFERTDAILKGPDGQPGDKSAMWRKCIAGLTDIESSLQKTWERRQRIVLMNLASPSEEPEALEAQRVLLTRQHESLAGAMTLLARVHDCVDEVCFRELFSKAASLDTALDISYHYLPIITSLCTRFGSDEHTQASTAHELHKLFAAGPGQQQWKQQQFKAATITCWLAEYSARFSDTLADPALRVADRQKAEQERSDLFMQCIRDKAFHFLLGACKFLKPETWHDPAKLGLVGFLLAEALLVPVDAPPASVDFAVITMRELQGFTEQVIGTMPDVVRRLKMEEDEQRRLKFSLPSSDSTLYEPDLERFIVIMAYAYQDDHDAAHDFWTDKEGNLYGFLRWVSQRLPTPRVAAFCELLRAIANSTKAADQAHHFLLEDTAMVSGRLRKTYSVSWTQIFAELDTFATSLRERPALPTTQQGTNLGIDYVEGVETSIMLEAYLRLAAHICRESPEARKWLLRDQSFHLGDVLCQLASSGIEGRLQASCFNTLAALLTDKVQEVNDGMWVMLDNWISLGLQAGSNVGRPQPSGRAHTSERNYLQHFNDKPETATAVVTLFTALLAPSQTDGDATLDMLPFPESLGIPSRHAGIDQYVDFVIGVVFKQSQSHLEAGSGPTEVLVMRHACLDFIVVCLTTFNEDLVLLANTTDVAIDATIRTSSLAAYARLHPFARVMEWLFNSSVTSVLFAISDQPVDDLNDHDIDSPLVQTTLRSVKVMNLAMKLQTTYFDIIRPIVKTHSASRTGTVANAALASFEDVVVGHLPAVAGIIHYSACRHAQLSLEALAFLDSLACSRKLSEGRDMGSNRSAVGNRLIGALASSSELLATELMPSFLIEEFDVETGEEPFKLIKARAVLKMLNSNLNAPVLKPTVAHCLLGFQCGDRTVSVAPGSGFESGDSLFHAIVTCAATAPIAVAPSNLSWLLSVKRGCWDVVLKLALSPLTGPVVRRQLQDMEPLAPASKNQISVTDNLLWDSRHATDPEALIDSSAEAIRDFFRVREAFFQYAALVLRSAVETGAYSVQERASSILRGIIRFPDGSEEPTMSVFAMFDFLDLETTPALGVTQKYLANLDLAVCMRDDPEIVTAIDTDVAAQLFILRARELAAAGTAVDAQQLEDEIRATIASLHSQNNWRSIQNARLAALDSWTDLVSLMLTCDNLTQTQLTTFALQGLQVILPKFERALATDMESASLLAKVTLALVPAATTPLDGPRHQSANNASERLHTAFRVCLQAITHSDSGSALRDTCYLVCFSVADSLPFQIDGGKPSPSQHAKQLFQLINIAGDRLLRVITEDAFSGRGSTRVSALLFLNILTSLFQAVRNNAAMLRAFSRLNFIPVLIDMSIGSVASSFQADGEELQATLAYFHTALNLLLNICRTADGTQLVLGSGLFDAIRDSRLFSTDPDIGLDIDNPVALKEFYKLLSAVLRVVISVVITRGPSNSTVMQQAKNFLQDNRFSMMAVFKRTSALQKTSGPPETEAMEVADEFTKLIHFTDFLEDDKTAHQRSSLVNGFT